MKTLKLMLLWLIGGLILIQFIQIKLPPKPKASKEDEIKAPKEVMAILKRSCYDCHSNEYKVPWYGYIAPISWEVRSHINGGLRALNFSIWYQYPKKNREKLLKDIVDSLWKMPPKDYLLIHKDAKISQKEEDLLRKWISDSIIANNY